MTSTPSSFFSYVSLLLVPETRMECRGTRFESQEKRVSVTESRVLMWDSVIRVDSNRFSLFLWQYRATTQSQLFHRLLSEHKVLINEHEQTDAAQHIPPNTSTTPIGPITRSRAKAIHDKVNSLLSLYTFDVSVNGSLPHGDTFCMLSYEPSMKTQSDAKDDQDKGQEEEEGEGEKTRGGGSTARRPVVPGAQNYRTGPVVLGKRHQNISTETPQLPEGPGTTGHDPILHGRYYRTTRGSTGCTELPDGPGSAGERTPKHQYRDASTAGRSRYYRTSSHPPRAVLPDGAR